MKDRRKNVSFKDNQRDLEILAYIDEMSKIYGFSTYVKNLIEKDMKEGRNENTNYGSE